MEETPRSKTITDNVIFNAQEIQEIISNAEEVCNDYSRCEYDKKCAKTSAYEQIAEIVRARRWGE